MMAIYHSNVQNGQSDEVGYKYSVIRNTKAEVKNKHSPQQALYIFTLFRE